MMFIILFILFFFFLVSPFISKIRKFYIKILKVDLKESYGMNYDTGKKDCIDSISTFFRAIEYKELDRISNLPIVFLSLIGISLLLSSGMLLIIVFFILLTLPLIIITISIVLMILFYNYIKKTFSQKDESDNQ